MRAVTSYSLRRRPTSEASLDEVQASGARIERRLLEKVVGAGFIEQRLDVAFEALVSSAGIVEKRCSPMRGQRQRRMKQPFDVQPVLRIHRTRPVCRLMVAYQAAREGLPPG